MKPWAWGVVTASLSAAVYLTFRALAGHPLSLLPPRQRFLAVLEQEIGKSDGAPYWQLASEHPPVLPKDWCGVFILWGLIRAFGVSWRWIDGEGFLFRLPRTQSPKPGDIGYADNGYNHQGVIESVNANGTITSIDGNSWFGQVRRNTRPASFWTAFFSIDPIISGELGR